MLRTLPTASRQVAQCSGPGDRVWIRTQCLTTDPRLPLPRHMLTHPSGWMRENWDVYFEVLPKPVQAQ